MVKLKEGRLFPTLRISLEILTYLLGKVYINRMTPVRITPCVNKPVLLVGRYKSLGCARAGGKKKKRATKCHRKEISSTERSRGVMYEEIVCVCLCVCV